MKRSTAVVLLVLGVVGLVVVYSMRPPEGFMDALGMLAQGKQQFIHPPFYQLLMAVSGFCALAGGTILLRDITPNGTTPRK